jgi:hypothetical protein
MLNLNLNTISSTDIGNPSLGPNSSKLTYDYSSSVWGGANEVEQQLTITISGSDEISRNPWERQFIASGSEAQNKTYPLQSGSSVNVNLEATTPFDTNPETFVELEYILVGGGQSGNRTFNVGSDCTIGGSGGIGGNVYTGSIKLAYGYSEVSISLSIPEIGYNDSTNFTSSILSPTFVDTGNEHYKVTASIEVVQFTDFYASSSIGAGGIHNSGTNDKINGTNSTFFNTNLGNQSLTSSLVTSAAGTPGSTVFGVAAGCNNNPPATGGENGYTWLNGQIYGSAGGSGRTRTSATLFTGQPGGANAGGSTSPNAPANFGGGGGGASAGTATTPAIAGGNGGSGVFIIRFFDPNDLITATGGVRTKIGDYVYHQFNTESVFNFTIPATNPYI